jgi:methionyl-tRNA formyltransferase
VRTVYMGTSEFAAAVLRRLTHSEHSPRLVITRPDKPRGRGRKRRGKSTRGEAAGIWSRR